jgi:hypothetical protein
MRFFRRSVVWVSQKSEKREGISRSEERAARSVGVSLQCEAHEGRSGRTGTAEFPGSQQTIRYGLP